MPVTEPRELLLHEMGDLLFCEQTVAKMLPGVIKETTDEFFSDRLMLHLAETETQIEVLNEAFAALSCEPKAEKCPAILGLKKEHDTFVEDESPRSMILDMFNTGAAARVEHYEIAAYSSAIGLADALGETQVCDLLKKNLRQEQAMLGDAEEIASRLSESAIATSSQ